MTARSRSRDMRILWPDPQGSYYYYLQGTSYRSAPIGMREWCTDTHGTPTVANPFELRKWEQYFPLLNGELWNTNHTQLYRRLSNWPVTYRPDPYSSVGKWPLPNDSEKLNLAWQILALTNPSRPIVSVPTFIAELKDIVPSAKEWRKAFEAVPFILRDFGNTFLRLVASGHITWRWALKPMWKDLYKMLTFYDHVEERLSWIKRLVDGKSVRRRVKLGTRTDFVTVSNVLVETQTCTIKAKRHTLFEMKEWGSCRWTLLNSLKYLVPTDEASQRSLAERIVEGITGYETLSAAWELFPWSWLADWFVGVGDFIASQNNTLPAVPSHLCYMRTTKCSSKYEITERPSWVSIDGTYFERETHKYRLPLSTSGVSDVPLPTMTILENRQWSILASLAALRHIPRSLPKRLRPKIK